MNTEIENIIIDHEYAELTPEQLSAIQDWAENEEEYSTMRQIITSAPLLHSDVAPSPKLKSSLMETFAATHAAGAGTAGVTASQAEQKNTSNKKVLYLWYRSAAAVAAIVLALFLIYPFFNSSNESEMVAENKVIKTDEGQRDNKTAEVKKEKALNESITENPIQTSQVEIPQNQTSQPAERLSEAAVFKDANTQSTSDYLSNVTSDAMISKQEEVVISDFSGTGSGAPRSLSPRRSEALNHSDRLLVADLPVQSRQIIQDRPELLDLLHTSF